MENGGSPRRAADVSPGAARKQGTAIHAGWPKHPIRISGKLVKIGVPSFVSSLNDGRFALQGPQRFACFILRNEAHPYVEPLCGPTRSSEQTRVYGAEDRVGNRRQMSGADAPSMNHRHAGHAVV
jgi:hypothetical protein